MSYTVIIPTCSIDKVRVCVQAIKRVEPETKIIVVEDRIDEPVEGCRVITVTEPFIFARNVNIGIKAAGEDDVILLNDDAVLVHGSLLMLMACTAGCGGMVSAAIDGVVNNPEQQRYVITPRHQVFREVHGYLAFVCVAIPREVINKVGFLDERFGGKVDGEDIYGGEDVDYCHRAREKGIGLYVYDGCVMDHGRILHSTFKRTLMGTEMGMKILRDKWLKG